MDTKNIRQISEEAIANPKVGMRFEEMFSYWVYVVALLPGGGVVTRSFGGHPANPPADQIKYETLSAFEFAKKVRGMLLCDLKALECIEKEVYCTTANLSAQ